MKAIILAGGVGTRMRPLTFSIPKPLVPFGEKPIIENAILSLRAHGVKEILISLGYMPELIRAYCRDGQQWGLKIEYLIEEKPLGTAGPMTLAREKIGADEDFILMNGDVVTDLDFAALVNFHKARQVPVTMAYAEVVTKSPFGVVEVENGRLLNMREKPDIKQYVNAGIYAINNRCISLVPADTFFTMVDLVSLLIKRKESVGAFPISGFWKGLESRENLDDALFYLNANGGSGPVV